MSDAKAATAHIDAGEREEAVATTPPSEVEVVEKLGTARARIIQEVQRVIVGQDEVIDLLLICVFSGGHALFIGVPGLAKTLLIRTLAEVLDLHFNRIQFTPDLMPSDITGTEILEEDAATGTRRFRFVPGPVFTNILLADEVNRTPPKTQAALLQSMAEGQVTAGGHTHLLEKPYLVFATQNPIEQEGTYPLPEAQLDRFLMQVDVGYPSPDEEAEIVRRTTAPLENPPQKILDGGDILALQAVIPRVPAADHVIGHAVDLVRATRPEDPSCPEDLRELLAFGAGPRASQALILAAKARAVLDGRFAAEIDDVRALAHPVLRHRLVLSFRAVSDGRRPGELLDVLLERVRP